MAIAKKLCYEMPRIAENTLTQTWANPCLHQHRNMFLFSFFGCLGGCLLHWWLLHGWLLGCHDRSLHLSHLSSSVLVRQHTNRVHNHIKKRLEPRVRRSWSKSQRNEDIRPEMLQHCLANITQASRDFRSVGGLRSRTSKLSNSAHAPVEPASAQFCGIAAAALPNPLQSVDSTR